MVEQIGVPEHMPVVHLSLMVVGSLSLHGELSALAGFEHMPVALSHVPALWQLSMGVQVTPKQWSTPTQSPAMHLSPKVRELPSSQVVLSGRVG